MAYPPLVELNQEQEDALKLHLDKLLTDHDAEREPFIDDLIKWQKDYWAKSPDEKRTFPFAGSASIIVPLTAITFETVHAQNMTQLFGLRQFVSAKPVNPQVTPIVTSVEQYFDHELKHSIKFRDKIESAIIELEKFGTGVACSGYENVVKWGVRDVGGEEQEFPVTTSRGATVNSVALSRFLCPFGSPSLTESSWAGEEHATTPYKLYLDEQGGLFYEGTHAALKFWYNTPSLGGVRFEESQQKLENRVPSVWNEQFEYIEFWFSYDLAENGRQREFVAYYHRHARVLMGLRNNWNFDLRRKYRTGVYFPVEHRITGVGIAKQNEQFQREVTTQHRQRLDNATVANMRMLKVSKLSGYGPKEPIFPGKMWFLDDMTHVDSLQMGEVYPSSFNNEQLTLQYAQQRTGVNEITLGMPQQGTPGTATSDLARVKEGKRKSDYTFGNIKSFVDAILNDTLLQLAQFGPSSMYYFDNIAGGALVRQFLSSPPELIKRSLLVEIAAAGERDNDIVDRQNWMQVSQMLQQYYVGMIQLAQTLGSPQIMQQVAIKSLSASTSAMKQILESYDNIKNVDSIIIPEFLALGANNGAGQLLNAGGAQGNPQPSQAGGMGNPQEIAGPS
jgi:hypothetical protein